MPDTEGILADLFALRDRVSALISKVSGESEKPDRTPPPEIAKRMAKNLCIRCGQLAAETRGLCNKDYQGVRRMLHRKKISDAEAVERWLWLAEAPKGRPSKYMPEAESPGKRVGRQAARDAKNLP